MSSPRMRAQLGTSISASACSWRGEPGHLLLVCTRSKDEVSMLKATSSALGIRNSSASSWNGETSSFPWTVTLLASVLITTIVVDVLGNLLVIVSVFRNKKLRKAGKDVWEITFLYIINSCLFFTRTARAEILNILV